MTILCLTGWQQKYDALAEIAPKARHFDYAAYDNARAMFAALPKQVDLAIGWSLGGQLLVQAIAGGFVKAKTLLLIGAPFQCIASKDFPYGMSAAEFGEIRENYRKHPKEMVFQFNTLVGMGNPKTARIIQKLNQGSEIWKNGLYWLDELGKTSCASLDYSKFSKTIILHGATDKIINPANANKFAEILPDSELIIWQACGHAPHLQDAEGLRNIIKAHV